MGITTMADDTQEQILAICSGVKSPRLVGRALRLEVGAVEELMVVEELMAREALIDSVIGEQVGMVVVMVRGSRADELLDARLACRRPLWCLCLPGLLEGVQVDVDVTVVVVSAVTVSVTVPMPGSPSPKYAQYGATSEFGYPGTQS